MFQGMNPQLMQMMMQQQGQGMPNMAPQITPMQSQQAGARPQVPLGPQQQQLGASPNGGIFSSLSNNPMIQGMMGSQMAPQASSYHGQDLPWQQGFSAQGLENSQIANPANMSGIQGFMGRNGIANPFVGPANAAPILASAAAPAAADAGATAATTAAASSMPEWMTALMAFL